jgi:alpha-ketoglutarate-dependent taurine dioxygenase
MLIILFRLIPSFAIENRSDLTSRGSVSGLYARIPDHGEPDRRGSIQWNAAEMSPCKPSGVEAARHQSRISAGGSAKPGYDDDEMTDCAAHRPMALFGLTTPPGKPISAPVVGPSLSPAAGVLVDGIDVSMPISPLVRERLLDAFRCHHVLVFRNQTLSREQQFLFIANFGEVERSRAANKRYGVAHVISNLGGDGKPVDRSASSVSNYNWHTDKPYYREPPMMTALYAVEMPRQGGDTEFANTVMAHSALTPDVKRGIAGLRVVFYWGASQSRSDQRTLAGNSIAGVVDHPLVRTHPETGAKALYLGNHASHILGWPLADGRALLDQLLAHATQPQFVYAHRWRVGDLVIWDNRCLLHRAVANFELSTQRRILHRVVVRGTLPF